MPFILLVTAAFILFPVIMIPINFLLMNAVNGKAKYYFYFYSLWVLECLAFILCQMDRTIS